MGPVVSCRCNHTDDIDHSEIVCEPSSKSIIPILTVLDDWAKMANVDGLIDIAVVFHKISSECINGATGQRTFDSILQLCSSNAFEMISNKRTHSIAIDVKAFAQCISKSRVLDGHRMAVGDCESSLQILELQDSV